MGRERGGRDRVQEREREREGERGREKGGVGTDSYLLRFPFCLAMIT